MSCPVLSAFLQFFISYYYYYCYCYRYRLAGLPPTYYILGDMTNKAVKTQGVCQPGLAYYAFACRHCRPTESLPLPRHLFTRSLSEG